MRGSKPRVWITGQAQGLHAPPAIAGETDCQPAPQRRYRLASANSIHTTGVSKPGHPFSVARLGLRSVRRHAKG